MNEKVKRLLEVISEDQELSDRAGKAASFADIVALAGEKGIELTEDDLKEAAREQEKIDPAELDAVAGGKTCGCAIGGGGTGDRDGQSTCWCFVGGAGSTSTPCTAPGKSCQSTYTRCQCPLIGVGDDMNTYEAMNRTDD